MSNTSLQVNNVPEIQQEFLSMAEVAQLKQKSLRSVQQSVKQYKNFLEGYVSKKYHRCSVSGKLRKMTVISKHGLIKLMALVDNPRSKKKNEARLRNLTGKSKIAEKAIAATQQTPIQALLATVQQMANMESKMAILEQKIDTVTDLVKIPENILSSQRIHLNDRARNYAVQTDTPYWTVWKSIHSHVGIFDLNNYSFNDYTKAKNFLKAMYKASNLNWN